MNIQLPKLKKINVDRIKKKKILLISDDIKYSSGISTIAREIVFGTANKYDWVQLAAALKHPDHGKVMDLSPMVESETGYEDVSVKQYCHNGYGNQDVIREIIQYEKPDLILLITDPRFFGHVFQMEHELRSEIGIPVSYLSVWDNSPNAAYNQSAYSSCDLLMSINRQTKVFHKMTLETAGIEWFDLDEIEKSSGIILSYVPHGLNPKQFYKQTEESPDWNDFVKFRDDFKKRNDVDFIIVYNSRNIRRKQPGDIILSYKHFCDQLPKENAKKCCLIMKTAVVDENGTDLLAAKRAICPNYKIIFDQEWRSPQHMNWLYNLADCTFFMSSAEGFGLAANESLLCGTMLIAPVTGGLQDQMRFEDEDGNWIKIDSEFTTNHRGKYRKCGKWAYPIFPRGRALQGSPWTPYIFDDYSDAEDAANGLKYIYDLGQEQRDSFGLVGQAWVLGEESGMSSPVMNDKFIKSVEKLFETWKPKPKYELLKIQERQYPENTGIQW